MGKLLQSSPELAPDFSKSTSAANEVGELIANAHLNATKQGFDERYKQGLTGFLEAQANPKTLAQCRDMGAEYAASILEAERRTMIEMSGVTSIIGLPPYITAVALGLDPLQSVLVFVPSLLMTLFIKRG